MQIVPGPNAAGQFHLKFVLMQTGKPEATWCRQRAISLDGLQGGKPQT